MFTRVILAAGVAALAISAPASAQRDRGDRGDRPKAERTERAQQRTQKADRQERAPRVERTERAQRVERAARTERVQRAERAPRVERAERVQRQERVVQRAERAPRVERQQRVERAARVERAPRVERQARIERQQARAVERQQVRVNQDTRAQLRADRQALQINRQQARDERRAERQILQNDARWARIDNRLATRDALRNTRFAALDNRITTQFVEPVRVRTFIGQPVRTVSAFTPLLAMPSTISYLYPDDDDYYWRYGGGYVYRVDRGNDLISLVLPLLAGGFMPGQYLPNSYMNSYAPSYWGLNSFYPATYSGGFNYGYGYDNLCNRYANGVIYRVDCLTGMIVDVVPMYAGGYGVGQMLPSSYSYYNVPMQYRDLYYDNDDWGYWYAPGAIYRYDRDTALISSVAALLSPGFSVGQPLPMGYSTYNVPYAYRSTYFDTPNSWYRYNNGYIYQVDPATQLVTAIVASILT